ncbi:glutathione S-transferase 1-like [Tribolium madens]|uniref:glutathione S-transferase 1-like n=1 Tax=Tribolium madens TaxID=41895 RepID=UPI001CF72E1C|nr:glutathione S-transferase 1-like [Tribolium madens]
MAPTLYMLPASPPCRAVVMTAKALGVEFIEKGIYFFRDDNVKTEFCKINPQHTIPTFVDEDGFVFWDSHAIMAYMVAKYAKNDSLYPEDVKKRAIVNQRLFFESSVIFFHMKNIACSILLDGKNFIDSNEKQALLESFDVLEKFIEDSEWMAGNSLTIADYSLVSSIASVNNVIPIDPEKYPKLIAWFQRCKSLPEYEVTRKGQEEGAKMLNARLNMSFLKKYH